MTQTRLNLAATVLDSPNPGALGHFYARLLGWTVVTDESEWVQIKPEHTSGSRPGLSGPVQPANR